MKGHHHAFDIVPAKGHRKTGDAPSEPVTPVKSSATVRCGAQGQHMHVGVHRLARCMPYSSNTYRSSPVDPTPVAPGLPKTPWAPDGPASQPNAL